MEERGETQALNWKYCFATMDEPKMDTESVFINPGEMLLAE